MPVLAQLSAGGATFAVRRAERADVGAIVALIAADQLGAAREAAGDLAPYDRAFATVDADPAQLLVVVAASGGAVVGTLQLTFIPGLARRGGLRAHIEAVRVREDLRARAGALRGGGARGGRGLGHARFAWAIDEAERRGCGLAQLTSHKSRADA